MDASDQFKANVADAIARLQELYPDLTKKDLASAFGIQESKFQKMSKAQVVCNPEVYAVLYEATGMPEFDPRSIPPRLGAIPNGGTAVHERSWSEDEWQRWLAKKSASKLEHQPQPDEQLLSADLTELRSRRPKAVAPETSSVATSVSQEPGVLATHRPKPEQDVNQPLLIRQEFSEPEHKSTPAKQEVVTPPIRLKRTTHSAPTLDAQALADAFVQVIQVATWPLTERLMAIEQQLQIGENPLPQQTPKPGTQPPPVGKALDPSVVFSEMLAILRSLKSGSVEERDKFAEEYKPELIELVLLADPLTRSKEARERELASNMEVKIR